MNYDFGNIRTIEEVELLNLQIEEYKRTLIKNRQTIVKLREERDKLMEEKNELKKILKKSSKKI